MLTVTKPGEAERAQGPATVQVIEVVGASRESWEDAARQILARVATTTPRVTGLGILRQNAVVGNGRISEYHLAAKVA